MAKRQSYYVGVKGLIFNNEGEVLLLRDTSKGKWEVPGGRIDHGEDITSSFAREIKEEIKDSKFIKLGDIVHVAQGDFLVENNHKLMLLFYKAVVALPKNIVLSSEHSDLAWVNKNTISNFDIYSTDKAAINICLS